MHSAHARGLCCSLVTVGGGVRSSHIGGESEVLGWWSGEGEEERRDGRDRNGQHEHNV